MYFCFYFQYSGRWVIEDPAVIYVGDMQNRKRDTDAQNRLLDSVGEGDGRVF